MDRPRYLPWYERYPERFAEERTNMEERGFKLNKDFLDKNKRVMFTGNSTEQPDITLLVKYPDSFPSRPPQIFTSPTTKVFQRHHRPGTNEICLFGPNPQQPRWSAELLGTTAIDEAEAIIRSYSGESVNTPEHDIVPEPVTSSYPYVPNTCIFIPPDISTPFIPPEKEAQTIEGTFHIKYRLFEDGKVPGQGLVTRISFLDEAIQAEEGSFNSLVSGLIENIGTLVYLPSPPPFELTSEWLKQLGVTLRNNWTAFIFYEQSGDSSTKRLSWLILRTHRNIVHPLRAFPLRIEEREVRVPGTIGLFDKKVVFVGCGSVGSKIAVGLAATGVADFVLIDHDFFEPNNTVRHEVGFEASGLFKVNALKERIININPFSYNRIQTLAYPVGGDLTKKEEELIFNLIAYSDLVVETTGIHGISRYINDICFDLKVPSLYATVTNGAWGGEVVRVIPGETPCWLCWYTQYEDEKPPSSPVSETGLFAPGCDQPTFTGTSYEVGILANLACWMAAETLLRKEPNRNKFDGNYVRWTARSREGSPKFTSEILAVEHRDYCPWCNC